MRGFSILRDLEELSRTAFPGDGEADARRRGEMEALLPLAEQWRYGSLAPLLGRLGRARLEAGDGQADGARLVLLQAACSEIVGEWDQAEALFREVSHFKGVAYEQARAQVGIARIKGYRGEFEEALRHFDEALVLAREVGPAATTLQALIETLQAGLYSRTGDQQRAKNLLEEAVRSVPGDEPDARYVQSLAALSQGLFAFREGDLPRAEDAMQRALGLLDEKEYPVERGDLLRYVGVIKGGRGQNVDSLATHQAALRLFRQAGYTFGQARIYNSIGRTFLQLTRLEEAIFYMEKGVRICRELRADAELATVYGKIGNAYMLCEDYGRAIHYLQRDLELSNRFKNYYALGYTHRNLGRCYTLGGNLEDGIQHLNESLGLFQFVEDSANTGRVYLDLCQANAERGKLQEARQMGGKALHLLQSHRLASESAYAHIVLGGIERRLGNLDGSAQHLAEAMSGLEGKGSSSRLAEGYYELGQLAADRGDREKAFACLEKALVIAKELGLKKHATRCFAVMEGIGDLELLQVLTRDLTDRVQPKVEVA